METIKKHSAKKVCLLDANIPCGRRLLDKERLKKYFALNGYIIVDSPKTADLNVIITCGFCTEKQEESLALIKTIKQYPGEMFIAGCLPGIAPEKMKKIYRGRYIQTDKLEVIDQYFPDFKVSFASLPDPNQIEPALSAPQNFRQFLTRLFALVRGLRLSLPALRNFYLGVKRIIRQQAEEVRMLQNNDFAILRVSRGCSSRCAYCGIHRAVGPLKSKPLKEIVQNYQELLAKGIRQFALLACDIGAYGTDFGLSFSDLLNELAEQDAGFEVAWNIIDIRPIWAVQNQEAMIRYIKQKKIKIMLCPIQSGSPRTLKKMGRYEGIAEVISTLKACKAANPDLLLATDVIVGFPGETEEDFQATLEALRQIRFDYTTFIPYAEVEDTPASRMSEQVPAKTITRRHKMGVRFLKAEKLSGYDPVQGFPEVLKGIRFLSDIPHE